MEYFPGDLNLIITVPHNGKEKAEGLEDRFEKNLDGHDSCPLAYQLNKLLLPHAGKMVTRTLRGCVIFLAPKILR